MYKQILFCIVALSSLTAQAREFYRIDEKMDLNYTSLKTGTESVFRGEAIQIRVSDDREFCQIVLEGDDIPCSFDSRYDGIRVSFVKRDDWIKFFNHLEQKGVFPSRYNEKMNRILSGCSNCNYFVTSREDIHYQIDDAEPEAFHLYINEIEDPVKL